MHGNGEQVRFAEHPGVLSSTVWRPTKPRCLKQFRHKTKKEKRSQHLAITEKQLTLSLNRMDYSTGRRIFFAANWKCGFSSVPPFSYGSYSRQREALNKEDRRKWMMNWSAGLWCEEVAWFTWSEVLLQICQPKKKKFACVFVEDTQKRENFLGERQIPGLHEGTEEVPARSDTLH